MALESLHELRRQAAARVANATQGTREREADLLRRLDDLVRLNEPRAPHEGAAATLQTLARRLGMSVGALKATRFASAAAA